MAAIVILLGVLAVVVVRMSDQDSPGKADAAGRNVMLGAYVDPPIYIDSDRIAAYEAFEDELGGELDIYHGYHPWDKPFPSEDDRYIVERGTTLLLSWAGTDTRDITSGMYDDMIRTRARDLRELEEETGGRVILQWRWEMNRPNLQAEIHSPEDYVAAWRHLRNLFSEEGATGIEWAWNPLAGGAADENFEAYYPGDDQVDWIGANGYPESSDESFAEIFSEFFEWAEKVDRPIMIGEFARPLDMGSVTSLEQWLKDARETVDSRPQIKAVVYFESSRGLIGDFKIVDIPPAMSVMRGWLNPKDRP